MNITTGREVEFIAIFKQAEDKIRSMPGCLGVALFQHQHESDNSVWTISEWESTDDLENYRKSEVFKDTWSRVKPLFSSRPSAWSLSPVS